jgi:PAS domain S-box-containing protein
MAETSQHAAPDTQLFRDVFNASPIGIAVENWQGQPLFVNPAFCSMLGFSEEELRSKHCRDFSPAEDAEKDWALFQLVTAGKIDHYQLEKRYFRRDGSLVWGRLSISLLKGGTSPLILALVEDITDKKKAEEVQFRHAALVESSDDAIVSRNLDGTIATFNAAAHRTYGYTEAEVVGKPIAILVPPELLDEENRIVERLRAGERIEHYETVRINKEGNRINVSLSISPIKDSNGRTLGFYSIARDITERKCREEALRASEERLRLSQQIAHIGAFERDIRSDVARWTPEMEGLYGLPSGSFAGTKAAFENLLHPDDRTQVMELVNDALKSGQPTAGEWRVIWPDGSVHWIAGRWQVLSNTSGERVRVVGVNMDVTNRKLKEDKLREYERAVEGTEELILVLDREYRVLVANREFVNRRNLRKDQIVGHFIHEFETQQVYEAVIKPKLDECFRGKVIRYELKYTDSKLGERDLLVSYYPVEGKSGIDRVVCILHDITDRKQADRALAEMAGKLIEAQEQERTRIARELHDDINQRLALLSIEIEASQKSPPDSPASMSLVLAGIRERLDEMSSDVQSISHQLHSSQLEYLGIVAAARSFCREFSARHNVKVDFRHNDVPRTLSYNVCLCLFRVLQEALHNAGKHSKVRRFDVTLSCSEHQLELTVSDCGVGFANNTAQTKGGLGLISMRERVRLVNGTIAIESTPMRGTTIHVCIPMDELAFDQVAV